MREGRTGRKDSITNDRAALTHLVGVVNDHLTASNPGAASNAVRAVGIEIPAASQSGWALLSFVQGLLERCSGDRLIMSRQARRRPIVASPLLDTTIPRRNVTHYPFEVNPQLRVCISKMGIDHRLIAQLGQITPNSDWISIDLKEVVNPPGIDKRALFIRNLGNSSFAILLRIHKHDEAGTEISGTALTDRNCSVKLYYADTRLKVPSVFTYRPTLPKEWRSQNEEDQKVYFGDQRHLFSFSAHNMFKVLLAEARGAKDYPSPRSLVDSFFAQTKETALFPLSNLPGGSVFRSMLDELDLADDLAKMAEDKFIGALSRAVTARADLGDFKLSKQKKEDEPEEAKTDPLTA